jgi:tetratricopeptide (TPR) repeat protein
VQHAVLAARHIAVRYRPGAATHLSLGNAQYVLGRYADAEAAYREAIRLDPKFTFAHNGLGNTLYNLGRFEAAETVYREAIRLDPDYAFASRGLGMMLYEQGRFEEAEAVFRETIDRHPDDSRTHGWYGLLLATGQLRQAAAELARAGDDPFSELLLWAVGETDPAATVGEHTPDRVLALLDGARPATVLPLSPFAASEIRALATIARGDTEGAIQLLRSAVPQRMLSDRFCQPLYDLLHRPHVAGTRELVAVWREIITADPAAAGPAGDPATKLWLIFVVARLL